VNARDTEPLGAMESRVEELEIRLAHLEYALQSQGEELLHLQQTNTQLARQVRELGERLRALGDAPGSDPAAEPPPPHY
jgi:SlyX protein